LDSFEALEEYLRLHEITLNKRVKVNIEKHFEELKETNFQNTFQKQAIQQMGEKSICSMFTNPTSSNTQRRKPSRYYFT
jgi:hypothetical protein